MRSFASININHNSERLIRNYLKSKKQQRYCLRVQKLEKIIIEKEQLGEKRK